MKSLISLFLIGILLMPAIECFSQEDKQSSYSSDESVIADNSKKIKKDTEDSFYNIQIDKLSGKFFARMAINLIAVLVLIRFIYFPNYKKRELFFTFFAFNLIIFLISYLLSKVDIGMGAAFGLFAVFSMLRYRTENISAKDMTYLFLAIAIGLITAISKASVFELGILNMMILLTTYLLEGSLFLKREFSQSIEYENIEMIKPEMHPALITDLKQRTGLNIHRVAIGKVNFLKDTAMVKLYYYEDNAKEYSTYTSPTIINNAVISSNK